MLQHLFNTMRILNQTIKVLKVSLLRSNPLNPKDQWGQILCADTY